MLLACLTVRLIFAGYGEGPEAAPEDTRRVESLQEREGGVRGSKVGMDGRLANPLSLIWRFRVRTVPARGSQDSASRIDEDTTMMKRQAAVRRSYG